MAAAEQLTAHKQKSELAIVHGGQGIDLRGVVLGSCGRQDRKLGDWEEGSRRRLEKQSTVTSVDTFARDLILGVIMQRGLGSRRPRGPPARLVVALDRTSILHHSGIVAELP